jgi:hypothetical protein
MSSSARDPTFPPSIPPPAISYARICVRTADHAFPLVQIEYVVTIFILCQSIVTNPFHVFPGFSTVYAQVIPSFPRNYPHSNFAETIGIFTFSP